MLHWLFFMIVSKNRKDTVSLVQIISLYIARTCKLSEDKPTEMSDDCKDNLVLT